MKVQKCKLARPGCERRTGVRGQKKELEALARTQMGSKAEKRERLYGGDNAFMVEERTPLWWKRERLCGGKANTFVVETRTPLWWKSERLCGGNENAFVVEKRTPLWWKKERLYGGDNAFMVEERTPLWWR